MIYSQSFSGGSVPLQPGSWTEASRQCPNVHASETYINAENVVVLLQEPSMINTADDVVEFPVVMKVITGLERDAGLGTWRNMGLMPQSQTRDGCEILRRPF